MPQSAQMLLIGPSSCRVRPAVRLRQRWLPVPVPSKWCCARPNVGHVLRRAGPGFHEPPLEVPQGLIFKAGSRSSITLSESPEEVYFIGAKVFVRDDNEARQLTTETKLGSVDCESRSLFGAFGTVRCRSYSPLLRLKRLR